MSDFLCNVTSFLLPCGKSHFRALIYYFLLQRCGEENEMSNNLIENVVVTPGQTSWPTSEIPHCRRIIGSEHMREEWEILMKPEVLTAPCGFKMLEKKVTVKL